MGREADGSKRIISEIIPVILAAVVFLVILLLVVFSAVSYQRSVSIQDDNNNLRAVLSYVTAAVKSGAGNEIGLTERDGVPVLVIEDGDTGFEQRIYFRDGEVKEAYVKTDAALKDSDAITVGHAERFDMKRVKDGLLEIDTDLGTSYVHIRNVKQ